MERRLPVFSSLLRLPYIFCSLKKFETEIMFEQLQKKWKVNSLQLFLILCTFAIGGSATGFIGKKIMNVLAINQDWLWTLVYILLITLIWPVAVIIISIPFGQFSFFRKYIRKIGNKVGIGGKSRELESGSQELGAGSREIRLAIFASGTGSNAAKIIDHFRYHPTIKIALIATNNTESGVLKIAEKSGISTVFIEKNAFFGPNSYKNELKIAKIDFIILAGFLWQIPPVLIKEYAGKIVNIHPALLPKYGGKGMYGRFVHEAVIANKEKESGITIHYVDEIYDHGHIIFQAHCPVLETDTAETLAQRVLAMEHEHYPAVIEKLLVN
jgi:formyltetrahydrofolate-dependent phosphoribosylglycinamide formyltransferase